MNSVGIGSESLVSCGGPCTGSNKPYPQALNTMTASQRLEATRGFSTRTSTSDLIHRKTPAKPKKKTLPPSKPSSGEEEAPKA